MKGIEIWRYLTYGLDQSGSYLALLGIRIVLAWEFFEAGLIKYDGSNWFAQIQDKFPFPFNVVPVDISWTLATYTELAGGIALLLGMGTRFFSVSLVVLTIVATAAVHWPSEWNSLSELARGYAITDKGYGNFKLPVVYLAMFLPLIFHGAGKISVDHLVARWFQGKPAHQPTGLPQGIS